MPTTNDIWGADMGFWEFILAVFEVILGIIGGMIQFVLMCIGFMIVFIVFCLMGYTIVVNVIEKINKF